MSENCLEGLPRTETSKTALYEQYINLLQQWKECLNEGNRYQFKIKNIQTELQNIYLQISRDRLSGDISNPEQREILNNADYKSLTKIYKQCRKEKYPHNGLVQQIEKEIYKKWSGHKEAIRRYILDYDLTMENVFKRDPIQNIVPIEKEYQD